MSLCQAPGSCTTYHCGFVPREHYSSMIPPSAYTYPPLRPGRADVTSSTMFPPTHRHNFYSQPVTFMVDCNSYPDYAGGQVEYHHHHHLYSASNHYIHPYYSWHFHPMVPVHLYNLYANYHPYVAYQRPDHYQDTWPEGFTMRGELQWGKLIKVFGPRKELPEFVKKDLQRVYGTYPRTSVSIARWRGEFFIKGDPKTERQEYAVEEEVIQQTVTPNAGEADNSGEDRNCKKKKKLRH